VIVRVVLGVVLTAALVAAATPAMEAASTDSADSTVDRQAAELGDQLQKMVDTNDPTTGRGARHVTEFRLPEETVTSAAVTELRLHSREGVGVATWRVGESGTTSRHLVDVPIRADGGAFTLRESGTHRLAFTLQSVSGRTVITVRRLGDGGNPDA